MLCHRSRAVRASANATSTRTLVASLLFLAALPAVAAAAPTISTLTPATGAVGASVTIAGSNFGSTQGSSTVKFNTTTAAVTTWSATSIVVPVPVGATSGNVVVTVAGVASNGKSFTVVAAPSITSLSQTSGAVTAPVTITGANFGASQGTSTVKFNGTLATATSWSATSIAVTVPAGATTGNVVVHASGVDSNGKSFTVIPTATITTLTPSTGAISASVTIAGTNFGATQGTSIVKFNTTTAAVTTWSATSIVVPVPVGATTGNVVVTVGSVASNGKSFTVVAAPSITSLSQTSGAVTSPVTITGTNFGASQGTSTVKFNGTLATATAWSATSIAVTVPAGATTGNVVVHASGVDSNGKSFTVVAAPSITSLSQTSGAVTAPVTITGANFGASQGTSTVKFNGTLATATAWSATSIAVTVPAGATTGNVVVHSGVDSNGSSFTVLPTATISTLTPTSGAISASVTIAGTNFGATQGASIVKFNTTTAAVTTWSATSIVAPVPAGATSGNVVVTVGSVASNGKSFSVVAAPSITSLSQTSGAVMAPVTITGANFGASQGVSTVKFNGTLATVTTWSSTSIAVTVPAGATTGNVIVHAAGVDSNGKSFTVVPTPTLTSTTPSVGRIGDVVTIAGTNLGTTQGTSVISFNGTPATPTVWTDTSITAPVPVGATSGPVTVTVSNQTSNGLSFTVQLGVLSNVYHLHIEPSSTSGLLQLKPSGPDTSGAAYVVEGTDLINSGPVSAAVQTFDTQPGDPGVTGRFAAGSNLYFVLWMSKSSAFGVVLPQASIGLNGPTGPTLCQATGSNPDQALTTTVTAPFVVSCLTSADVVLSPTDRLWVSVGYNMTQGPGNNSMKVLLWLEGTANNLTDSAVVPPALSGPLPPPTVTAATPPSALVGAAVTITGTNFGATQGTSGVTFNGIAATPTAWSPTSITTSVPVGATTGNIVVTVSNQASNGLPFTVLFPGTLSGAITRVTGGTGISGATVQAVQTGTVKGSATTAGNGSYSIAALDPGPYDVRVFASGFSSELRSAQTISSATTTTLNVAMYAPGSVGGRVTQADGVTPLSGAAVSVYSGPVQKGATNTNGTGDYTIAGLHPGSFTVQASNVGYATKEQGAAVTESATATSNFLLQGAPAAPVLYAYDELNRLVQVTSPAGESAIYRYDAVGNITAIERPGSSGVAIGAFTPHGGAIGTTVTIVGTGFNTTPAQNTVTFGGTATPVTSATATQLVTTVPAGLVSGSYTVGVTAPGGSATRDGFVVTAASAPPTIGGFTPAIAAAGATLTVNGTNFDPIPTNNNLQLNVAFSQLTSATLTALQTTVPNTATTGRVSVATPNGTASSANYLWVAPAPFAVSDVESTTTIAVGTPTTVSVNTADKVALLAFDGTAGHRAALSVTGLTGGAASVALYGPLAAPAGTLLFGDAFIDTAAFPSTGTYSIVFDPQTTNPTSATLTVYDVPPDFTSSIGFGGPAVNVTTTVPGQNGLLTFTGTPGHKVSIVQTGYNCFFSHTTLLAPDGAPLAGGCGGDFIDATPLTGVGTYSILIDPFNAVVGTTTVTLYDVPADVSGPLAFDTPLAVTTTVPGQNARLTFPGVAGHHISLEQAGYNCFTDSTSILDPAGVSIASTCGGSFLDVTAPLTATGTYTVLVDPVSTTVGSTTLTLHDVPADFTGAIAFNTPTVVTTTVPGQNGRMTFSGTANQRIALDQAGYNCFTSSTKLLAPNGSQVAGTCGGTFIDLTVLPVSGTYTLLVDPADATTGSTTLTLYDVPADASGSTTIGGSAVPLTMSAVAQNGSVTFPGTLGQSVTVHVTGNTVSGILTVKLVSVDGQTVLTQAGTLSSTLDLSPQTLPATGTYTVVVDPPGLATGSATVSVTSP